MLAHRAIFFKKYSCAIAAMALVSTVAIAQKNDEEPADTEVVMEELVVTAKKKSGDPVDVGALYEELMRERLMLEQDRIRDTEEEQEWRKSVSPTMTYPSRIGWGYSAEDELRMRRDAEIEDLPGETVRPATVFKVGFR